MIHPSRYYSDEIIQTRLVFVCLFSCYYRNLYDLGNEKLSAGMLTQHVYTYTAVIGPYINRKGIIITTSDCFK